MIASVGVIPTQKLSQVCYGGNFVASLCNIHRVNKSVWNNIETVLSQEDNIEEEHFLERSLDILLSTPLTTMETKTFI